MAITTSVAGLIGTGWQAAWIGLVNWPEQSGNWRVADGPGEESGLVIYKGLGTSGQRQGSNYTNWFGPPVQPGVEPDNWPTPADCVQVEVDLARSPPFLNYWNDRPCSDARYFVVEYSTGV